MPRAPCRPSSFPENANPQSPRTLPAPRAVHGPFRRRRFRPARLRRVTQMRRTSAVRPLERVSCSSNFSTPRNTQSPNDLQTNTDDCCPTRRASKNHDNSPAERERPVNTTVYSGGRGDGKRGLARRCGNLVSGLEGVAPTRLASGRPAAGARHEKFGRITTIRYRAPRAPWAVAFFRRVRENRG